MAFHFVPMKVAFTHDEMEARPGPPDGQPLEQAGVVFGSMVRFQSPVLRAEAVLQGFSLGYNDGDHNFGTERVAVRNAKIRDGLAVDFDVVVLLQDGDYADWPLDHPFHGSVDVLVLAEIDDGRPQSNVRWHTASLDFPLSPKVERTLGGSVSFGKPVKWAHAMLKGLRTEYGLGHDDNLFAQEATVHVSKVTNDVVSFEATFQLANWFVASGNQDPGRTEAQDEDTRAHLDVVIVAGL